jgi:hypothetical protein
MAGQSSEKESVVMSKTSENDATDETLGHVEDRLQEMVEECGPFYKSPSLLKLYLLMARDA